MRDLNPPEEHRSMAVVVIRERTRTESDCLMSFQRFRAFSVHWISTSNGKLHAKKVCRGFYKGQLIAGRESEIGILPQVRLATRPSRSGLPVLIPLVLIACVKDESDGSADDIFSKRHRSSGSLSPSCTRERHLYRHPGDSFFHVVKNAMNDCFPANFRGQPSPCNLRPYPSSWLPTPS